MDTERSNNFNIVIGFKGRCILAIKFSIDASGFVGKDSALLVDRGNNGLNADFFFISVKCVNLLDSMSSNDGQIDFDRTLADCAGNLSRALGLSSD